jgi:ComF family protein
MWRGAPAPHLRRIQVWHGARPVVRTLVDALLAVLLAPECACCHEPLRHPTRGCVCQRCWTSIPPLIGPLCRRCGDPLPGGSPAIQRAPYCETCAHIPSSVDIARAAGLHADALRAIVHALKYEGRRSVARPLAGLMRAAAPDLLRDGVVAVPVPLHRSKQRARGFNQADDLARHLGLPVIHALRRMRPTDSQTALPAAERRANVAGAFTATRHTAALKGMVVLLVDDVRTTGATLDACALVLKQAGVREVRALTAARVETPPG